LIDEINNENEIHHKTAEIKTKNIIRKSSFNPLNKQSLSNSLSQL
jgi:hypothetical protein